MATHGPGRGFEVTPELVLTAATRDLPEQVRALAGIARTLDAHRVVAGAFGAVAASRIAAAAHNGFLEQSGNDFAHADEQLNTMIAGLKLTAAAVQRYDTNNANRINQTARR